MFFFTNEKLLDMPLFNMVEDNVSTHYVVADKLQYHVFSHSSNFFQSSLPKTSYFRVLGEW